MAHAQIALCRTQGNSTGEVKMNLVTDNILLAQSIVSNPLEIASYLRRLARRRPAVCFHPRNGVAAWTSIVHSIDEKRQQLRLMAPRMGHASDAESVREGFARGGILLGELDGARVQFALEHFDPQRQSDGWTLAGPMPRQAWRIQRRAAFRLQPERKDAALIRVRSARGLLDWPLENISAMGVRVRLLDDTAFPNLGTRWPDSFMELPDIPLLRAHLEVRWVGHERPGRGRPESRWIGCAIDGLDTDQAQALRRWIAEQQVQHALSRRLDEAVT